MIKSNFLKGIPWRFGHDWPGQRCEARTRRGELCQRPAKLPVYCCRLHGAASTGPRTKDGVLIRLGESKTKHGRFTKAEREKVKQISEKRRKIQNELKELESWFMDYVHLEKTWHKHWNKL
jgi:hypothetical protein